MGGLRILCCSAFVGKSAIPCRLLDLVGYDETVVEVDRGKPESRLEYAASGAVVWRGLVYGGIVLLYGSDMLLCAVVVEGIACRGNG